MEPFPRLRRRRTMVPVSQITSPPWPRRPFMRTKASSKRQNALPTPAPSASNEGHIFGENLASYGDSVSSTPIEPYERRGGRSGTKSLHTIKQDDPSAIGQHLSTNCSLQSSSAR